jgi:hypothetical protein
VRQTRTVRHERIAGSEWLKVRQSFSYPISIYT